jgi:hypothetical protein
MFGLLLILTSVPLIVAALNGDSTIIEAQDARLHGLYAGVVLLIAGVIIGKFWSLKWEMGRTPLPPKPVEQQIDLFEPRKDA